MTNDLTGIVATMSATCSSTRGVVVLGPSRKVRATRWVAGFGVVASILVLSATNHRLLYEYVMYRTVNEVFDPGKTVISTDVDFVDCRRVYREYRFGASAGERTGEMTVYFPCSPVKKLEYQLTDGDEGRLTTRWDVHGRLNYQLLHDPEGELIEEREAPPWLLGVGDQSLSPEERDRAEKRLRAYVCHKCRVKQDHQWCWHRRGPSFDGMRCNCPHDSHGWNQAGARE